MTKIDHIAIWTNDIENLKKDIEKERKNIDKDKKNKKIRKRKKCNKIEIT